MKILFVIEYFYPFAAGGSEWSTYYLAKELARKGHNIVLATPNFGSRSVEKLGSIKIIRFPFYLKLKGAHKLPGNFAFTNPLWLLWSALNLILIINKEKPDIIHVHGKYSTPPSVIANLIYKKPLITTVRDYLMICNYGMCLMNGTKACNLTDYFLKDFKKYLKVYLFKINIFSVSKNLLYAIWGRLSKNYLKFFVNKSDYLICISNKQKKILSKNGLTAKKLTIYTNYKFIKSPFNKNRKVDVIFVGRLTYGKGIQLFLEAIEKVKMRLRGASFTIVGEGFYKSFVLEKAKNNRNINYIPYENHSNIYKKFKEASVTVVPSIWEDPLPRVAMESISAGTPVIATRSGGLPEVIKNGLYGYLSRKNSNDLAEKIILGIKNERKLRANISNDFNQLSQKFGPLIASKHIALYKVLINKGKSVD